mgnify:CR=1 FL=1
MVNALYKSDIIISSSTKNIRVRDWSESINLEVSIAYRYRHDRLICLTYVFYGLTYNLKMAES